MDFIRRRDIFGYNIGGYQQGGSKVYQTNVMGGILSMIYKGLFILLFIMNMRWVFGY